MIYFCRLSIVAAKIKPAAINSIIETVNGSAIVTSCFSYLCTTAG